MMSHDTQHHHIQHMQHHTVQPDQTIAQTPSESLLETLADALAERGWALTQHILTPAQVSAVRDDLRACWTGGLFCEAAVGKGAAKRVHSEIRSDHILWLTTNTDHEYSRPALAAYWQQMEALRQTVNRHLFLGAQEIEAHYAVYPAGTFYKRHLDQHRGSKERLLTCILYVNEAWTAEDGGVLRLYDDTEPEGFCDVVPEGGTFVCFRSDLVEHEVLPAKRERYSVTGWLRKQALW